MSDAPGILLRVSLSDTYPEMAAAGLWTTASDLARFAAELQSALAGRPNRLFSGGIVSEMFGARALPGLNRIDNAAVMLLRDGERFVCVCEA